MPTTLIPPLSSATPLSFATCCRAVKMLDRTSPGGRKGSTCLFVGSDDCIDHRSVGLSKITGHLNVGKRGSPEAPAIPSQLVTQKEAAGFTRDRSACHRSAFGVLIRASGRPAGVLLPRPAPARKDSSALTHSTNAKADQNGSIGSRVYGSGGDSHRMALTESATEGARRSLVDIGSLERGQKDDSFRRRAQSRLLHEECRVSTSAQCKGRSVVRRGRGEARRPRAGQGGRQYSPQKQ